ncbi:MAG: FAD-dependent oxidoreductase [Chloroflexi bacterium]|nr:FAD-dependent oxidoreductase [Chloroflexota bacterium]MBU1751508.1 FAD-dependent oxidoreductase [Chloroflexota bacterium]MBU1879585.1 FAD-dependent oxidoreductase [Chloroflexota bacterium]
MATPKRIVVIGGVACGPKAAARARRLDPDTEITIIERGRMLSYAGCGMPYCVAGDIEDCRQLNYTPVGVPRDAVFFRNVKNVTVLDRTLAQQIDRENKTVEVVHIETGEYRTIPYDKLVLATGGLPFMPPIEGIRLNRVFRMHQPEDAVAMRDYIRSGQPKRAVIIGGGLIGLEMTEALARNNLHVTVIEMLPHILPGLLDVESAAFLTKYVRSLGVDIRAGEQVARIVGDDQGNVQKVVTAHGDEFPADLVLVAVGVRPNTKLAQDAGLEVSKFGIVVNEHLQTSDPDIYAGGDCVANRHLITGDLVFVPMGSTANKHGRVIGDNVLGGDERFPGVLGTAVLKVFDYNVGKTGLTEQQARDAGYDVVTALAPSPDCAHYYPTHKLVFIKLIADRETGKLLGIQALGPGEAVKRVDVMAAALTFGATAEDLTRVDLGYAPPYSTAIDIAAHAANIIRNKMDGTAQSISPLTVKEKLDRGDEFVWLDVRSPSEYEEMRIEDPRVKLIPLGLLRRRVDELPKDAEIITFCKISLRGYEAQRILEGEGFENVWFMDGGVMAWPYEVYTKPAGG